MTRDTAQDFFGLPLATNSTLSFTSGHVNYTSPLSGRLMLWDSRIG
ncbi:hypothetical protein [Methylocapsa aurea]